ncbi:MAG: LON peptidase substrate-binding domain-containing protein [Thermoleophilia bacterium]
METRDLGLFPLEMVLVPGERIPLHIFEPRYRQLYADCVLGDRPFVLVRAEEGVASRIGCSARFDELLQRMEDGRLHVLVVGVEPVEIVEETQGSLYFSALCGSLPDVAEQPDAELAALVTRRFGDLTQQLTGERREMPTPAGVPLSYAVASVVEIPAPIKQRLLETRSENERLDAVARSLDVLTRAAQRTEMAAERAKTNGKLH